MSEHQRTLLTNWILIQPELIIPGDWKRFLTFVGKFRLFSPGRSLWELTPLLESNTKGYSVDTSEMLSSTSDTKVTYHRHTVHLQRFLYFPFSLSAAPNHTSCVVECYV